MPRLIPHPDSPCKAVTGIEAEAVRSGPGLLALRYVLSGSLGDLVLPPRTASARTDGLWRHTCFEAFVSAPPHRGYCEFNLAPSSAWAAYRFDGYREGMRPADGAAPRIEVRSAGGALELRALLDLGDMPDTAWRVGLSAVVEAADGGISYWALAHPPGKPDFHNADCFVLELPETARP